MSTCRLLVWTCILAVLPFLIYAAPSVPRSSTSRTLLSKSETITSLSQIKNPRWAPQNVSTTAIYAAPFLKHRISMPAALSSAWSQLQSSSGSTSDSSLERRVSGQTVQGSSGEYVFPVRLGNPSQTLYLMFDTGSGDFWVWSWQMPLTLTSSHTIYNATSSTSSTHFSGQSFNVAYAAGTAYGTVWSDTVWIDGNGGSIGVGYNPIECADNIGGAFASLPAVDGVFGLNTWDLDSQTPTPQQTWLNFVLPQLASEVFTIALVQNGVGTMDFGFIDSTKYTGSLTYTPVVALKSAPDSGEWSFVSTGYAIGTRTFNTTSIPVLTDTGGNIVLLPQSMTLNYYHRVSGSYQQSDGSWAFPCASTLPTFTFGVGSSRIVVPSKFMTFAGLADGVNCYGAIQGTSETGYAYFGTPFLQALFVVHDYGGLRLGFAARTST